MKVLIVGGAGFLGANLARRFLRDKKMKVSVVDSLEPKLKSTEENLAEISAEIEFIQGDMRDASLMEKIVRDKEVIVNCAAQTSHVLSVQEPLFDAEINCLGNLTLLEAVRKSNPQALVVFTSSSTTQGKKGKPAEIYSANKGVVENYYLIYHQVYDLKTLVFRFANLYGPYGKGYPEFGFINYFLSKALRDEEITIYGDGSQRRNVMYVGDVTELLYQSLFDSRLVGQIHPVYHREHFSVREIAEKIVSVFGKGKMQFVDWPKMRKRIEIENVQLEDLSGQNKITWRPQYNFEEGLKETKRILEQEVIIS